MLVQYFMSMHRVKFLTFFQILKSRNKFVFAPSLFGRIGRISALGCFPVRTSLRSIRTSPVKTYRTRGYVWVKAHTAVSRKVVGIQRKSARDNPERYCG